ncbi:hypothetical protein ACH42_15020 [Endozoicomonas sp. (ex Bugula neritina AB1)]|nr:hypothetical protein ACH42_15020 [Endozoicomonas sp. (ex Bugula neritina AB1)]
MVLKHAEMVRRIALHLADRLDGACDPDDLIQAGLVGLLEAAERYDVIEGIPFEGYAYPRIRGAMLDGLRRNDWCPRNTRKIGRIIKDARGKLQQSLGREPGDEELAEFCELSTDEYQKTLKALNNASISSLDLLLESGEALLPPDHDRASDPLFEQRTRKALGEALKTLPDREKIIMSLYYDEELNQKEIALTLGLTEARISQLRSKAVKTLKSKLSEWL